MSKPSVEEDPLLKPVHQHMEKSDLKTSNDSIRLAGSTKKHARHKNAQKAIAPVRPKTNQAIVIKKPKNTTTSTPQLNSRVTMLQKICTGRQSLRFQITIHGLKKYYHKYYYKCVINPCNSRFSTVSDWNRHHLTFHKNVLCCTFCHKGFKTSSSRCDHMYTYQPQ